MKCSLILTFVFLLGCEKARDKDDRAKEFKLNSISTEMALKHIKKNKATFLEIGAKSCYSCKVMGKKLEDVKNKKSHFNVIFVDVFKDAKALKEFKIEAIPTQIIVNNNKQEIFRNVGVLDKSKIIKLIEEHNIYSQKR